MSCSKLLGKNIYLNKYLSLSYFYIYKLLTFIVYREPILLGKWGPFDHTAKMKQNTEKEVSVSLHAIFYGSLTF